MQPRQLNSRRYFHPERNQEYPEVHGSSGSIIEFNPLTAIITAGRIDKVSPITNPKSAVESLLGINGRYSLGCPNEY